MRIKITILFVLTVFFLVSCQEKATPTEPSGSAQVTSEQGLYLVAYTPDGGDIALNQMHAWTIRVTTADGRPVEDAQITVDGGMPAHGHGLPTQPQVTAYLGDGEYRVEGMRFQMGGEWVVNFTISTSGQTDTATFQLNLP